MSHDLRFSRREWLTASGALTISACFQPLFANAPPKRRTLLGFSLYGMKSLALTDALAQCAAIGYQCVELPLLADWPADSEKFSAASQKEFRDGLEKHKLRLTALMENLPLLGDEAKHQSNLQRLKAAAEISRTFSATDPPLVETVLGGKPAQWDELKQQFVDRLGDWAKVMAAAEVKLAVKAHISNAIQTPAQLAWVLHQVNNPWLTAAYDESHYELQKLDMRDSMKLLAERLSFVHVKDTRGEPGKFQFLLPGEGKTDYHQLFRLLAQVGYTGDVMVEVSGQLHSKPDYDPIAAAKKSYAALAPAMKHFGGDMP